MSSDSTSPSSPASEPPEGAAERLRTPSPAPVRRRSLAVPLGILLMALGLVTGPTLLEATIYPDGTVEPGTRRMLVLSFLRLVLVGCGVLLIWRRPRLTIVHLCALALVAAFCGLLGAVGLQLLYRPDPLSAGWRSFASPAEFNANGFRGQAIAYAPEDHVIVLLGDSHVESRSLPFESMPERRLEAHLNNLERRVKVFTLGTGGYGQDQQLLVLREYFRNHRADRVVLWQEPRNDVWNNMFRTHMFGRQHKPTFWLEGDQLLGPTAAMGEPLAASPIKAVALWQRAIILPWLDKIWEDRLPEPYTPVARPDGPLNRSWQERWDSNRGMMREENLATEKSHMLIALAPRSQRAQYGLDLTRALTQRIEAEVKTQGGAFHLIQVDTPYLTNEADEIYLLNEKCYRVSKSQYIANLKYLRDGFDASTLPVTVEDWKVGPEDSHLNAAATDQVMGDLALRLKDSIPAPRP